MYPCYFLGTWVSYTEEDVGSTEEDEGRKLEFETENKQDRSDWKCSVVASPTASNTNNRYKSHNNDE